MFLLSPVRQISDSLFTLLTAEQLARHGTFDLSPFFAYDGGELPYQLKRSGDAVLYQFPPGAVLLAMPWMAIAAPLGLGVIDARGQHDPMRERRQQKILAALLTALFVAGAWAALDRLLGTQPALWLTAALTLGTPVWTTASRGVWSQTAELAVLGLALPLIAALARGSTGGAGRLGLLAAAAYFCRPTGAIVIAVLGVWLLRRDRRAALRYGLAAAALLGVFMALSWALWGSVLPPYYLAARLAPPSADAALGILFSPSRGLWIFEPALAAALVFGVLRWRTLADRALFTIGALGLGLHAVLLASFPHWWGGHGYGPRLFTESVFFQVLIAASVVASLRREPRPAVWRSSFAALLLVGILLNAPGALSNRSNRWNWSPTEIDADPARLWDWGDAQFLAWLTRPGKADLSPAVSPARADR